jgi:antitoxin (DNA-binding transcriptional repressor) of toxin-antitoxin stability system
MNTFTVRDLRTRAGELVRGAEAGELSVVTKGGIPVFVAVPFDGVLLKDGIGVTLAVNLFDNEQISLSRAARMAGCSMGEMIDLLGRYGVSVIRITPDELDQELADFN